MIRKYPLVTGQVYHVMSKSIAGYKIFTREADFTRMAHLMRFFMLKDEPMKFSYFLKHDSGISEKGVEARIAELAQDGRKVQIIAYCIMPTHLHIVVKQLAKNGISEFMRKALDGYAKYFNTKYERQGTLWMSRFKNVLIENDEQSLHVTRYVHLNPVTAGLVKRAEDWLYSSYLEYVNRSTVAWPVTQSEEFIDMSPNKYRKFTEDHADFQRNLAIIQKQILE